MIAVIGDVHGELVSLKELYFKLTDKYLIHRIIFLGDLISKGKDSKKVVDFLIEMQGKTLVSFIQGNHDRLFIEYMEGTNEPGYDWAKRVGHTTVASFLGISREEALTKTREEIVPVLEPYLNFFKSFREYYVENTRKHKFIFSHEDTPFFNREPDELLKLCIFDELSRNKNTSVSKKKLTQYIENHEIRYSEFILVHGHSAIVGKDSTKEELLNVEPIIRQNEAGKILSVNIDTGCTYGGKLTAMIIDDDGNFTFESVQCDT